MLAWFAALTASLLTFVGGYLTVRRSEGPATARKRLPLLFGVTVAAGVGLSLVAATSPADWWNYLLIPGAAFEWYTVLIWKRRREEAGSVMWEFARVPARAHLLFLTGMSIFAGIMDLRANGISLSNLILFLFGTANLALFVGVVRYRPGVTQQGILLPDRLIRWGEVIAWDLREGERLQLQVRLRKAYRGLGDAPVFELPANVRDELATHLAAQVDNGTHTPIRPSTHPPTTPL